MLRYLTFITLSCITLVSAASDFKFESESHFSQLLRKDELMLEFLDRAIELEENKLKDLKNVLVILEKDTEPAADLRVYVEDINRSFKLMKRMAYDWRAITNFVSLNVTEELLMSMASRLKNEFGSIPNPQIGPAIDSLLRIRSFTNVSHAEFADGNLGPIKLNSSLNANDLYIIGNYTINSGNIVDGTKWLVEGHNRVGNNEDIFETNGKIIKLLAKVYFKTGHFDDIKKELDAVADSGKLRDDRPFRFLDEMEELKTAAEAAKNTTENAENIGTTTGKAPEKEDNSKYIKAYPKLPPILTVFNTSIKPVVESVTTSQTLASLPPEFMQELLGKSEEELMEMAGKPIPLDLEKWKKEEL